MWPFSKSSEIDPKKTYHDRDKLTDEEQKRMLESQPPVCPDCGSGLLEGPSAGLSVNVYCANEETCGSRFNVCGPFGVDRITDAQPNKPQRPSQTPYRN